MTLNKTMLKAFPRHYIAIILVLGIMVSIALLITVPAQAAQFQVDLFDPDPNADAPDFNPADGNCAVAPGGGCSLRAAIETANANNEGDRITFAGPGIITVNSDLPIINSNDPLNIDGLTAGGAGYGGSPLIQVDNGGGANNGIVLESNQNEVNGLSITGFNDIGVVITGSRNQVYSSYIGLDLDGQTANGNRIGVQIQGINANNNLSGSNNSDFRNVISGNTEVGINVNDVDSTAGSSASWNFSNANRILNNYIGSNAAGDAAVGNGSGGISVTGEVRYLIIGTPNNGNVISGNNGDGIAVVGADSIAMNIRGNFIGTSANGGAIIANIGDGIDFNLNQWNLIDGNVIAGNTGNGASLTGDDLKTSICDNLIGLNPDGDPLGNGGNGLLFNGGGLGVDGNYVGFSPPFGAISPPACNTGNTIANNNNNGVSVAGANRLVAIRGNSIFNNGGLGISLIGGANEGVTTPVLSNAGTDGNDIVLDINLFQQAGLTGPQRSFQVHFYANTDVCDPANPALEGEIYLGSVNINVDPTGFAEELSFVLNNAFIPGTSITATASARAISPPPATSNNWRSTSEFSACVALDDATDIQLQKAASSDVVQTGGALTYNLNVTNNSTVAATNVSVEDTLPAGVTLVSILPDLTTFPVPPYCQIVVDVITCDIGTLAAGDSFGITVNVTAPITPGNIINRAEVTSDEPDIRRRNNTASVLTRVELPTPTPLPTADDPQPTATDLVATATMTTTITLLAPSPTLTLTALPSATATSSPTSTATQTATSTQTASPTASATSTSTATSTATATQTATATASSTSTSTATQTATATASSTATQTATPTITVTSTTTQSPTPIFTPSVSPTLEGMQLEMLKSLDAQSETDDNQVAFNVTINNQGSQAVSNVVLIEQLLDGVDLIAVDAGQPICTKTLDSISCALGDLAGGSSARVNFLVQTDGQANPLLGRSIVRSADLPDISLTEPYIIKLASPAFLQANGDATWTIRLLNPGTTAATNVVITDMIPSQLEITSATSTAGTVTTSNGRVNFRLARLEPITAVTITIGTRLIDNSVTNPVITNRACLQSTQRPQQQCVQAPVFRVEQLPNTGESEWFWLRWLLIPVALLASVLVLRRMKQRSNLPH